MVDAEAGTGVRKAAGAPACGAGCGGRCGRRVRSWGVAAGVGPHLSVREGWLGTCHLSAHVSVRTICTHVERVSERRHAAAQTAVRRTPTALSPWSLSRGPSAGPAANRTSKKKASIYFNSRSVEAWGRRSGGLPPTPRGKRESEHFSGAHSRHVAHTWLQQDCSLWSLRAQQTHSERSWWSR